MAVSIIAKTETKKAETKKTETKTDDAEKTSEELKEKVPVIEIIPETAPEEISDSEFYKEVDQEQLVVDFDMPDEGSDEDVLEHTELTGSLQALNITEEEAIEKINSGDSKDIYETALSLGDLKVTINNDYADNYQETMYSSYYNNISVPNFESVLDSLLTSEQKLKIAKGESPYEINLNIINAENQMSIIDKQLIQDKKGSDMAIGTFFDILLMQDYEGVSSMISELPSPMTMVMNIPEEYISTDRTYSIIRLHREKNGKMSVAELPDEDTNPSTITFTTDKFSYYGLAFRDSNGIDLAMKAKTGEARASLLIVLILIVVLAAMTMVVFYLVLGLKRAKVSRKIK